MNQFQTLNQVELAQLVGRLSPDPLTWHSIQLLCRVFRATPKQAEAFKDRFWTTKTIQAPDGSSTVHGFLPQTNQIHGEFIKKNALGQVVKTATFVRGQKHGVVVKNKNNGQVRQLTFNYGILQRDCSIFNGVTIEEKVLNGETKTITTYYSNGQKESETKIIRLNVKHGKETLWRLDGYKDCEVQWSEGKKHGWEIYWGQKKMRKAICWDRDIKQGMSLLFCPDHSYLARWYKNGRLCGEVCLSKAQILSDPFWFNSFQ